MDKQYILEQLRARMKALESEYRKYFDLENGPCKSASGAACMRSRIKRDLDLLKLLEYLVLSCPNSLEIDDQELEHALERLIEPRRLK